MLCTCKRNLYHHSPRARKRPPIARLNTHAHPQSQRRHLTRSLRSCHHPGEQGVAAGGRKRWPCRWCCFAYGCALRGCHLVACSWPQLLFVLVGVSYVRVCCSCRQRRCTRWQGTCVLCLQDVLKKLNRDSSSPFSLCSRSLTSETKCCLQVRSLSSECAGQKECVLRRLMSTRSSCVIIGSSSATYFQPRGRGSSLCEAATSGACDERERTASSHSSRATRREWVQRAAARAFCYTCCGATSAFDLCFSLFTVFAVHT